MKLVHQGFYNGLTFQRVVRGFIVQGGIATLGILYSEESFQVWTMWIL
ncbi:MULTISPECIES: peptidylprolyl isomerase [unclassified Paenibacillus]|jgi:cyclophilin family peptidyl-prolyl cis-trans isomerase|nr:peptidylprolyl isomerase [Paenibacillus odorifer]ETT47178.1 hypothetical protein C171_26744 [Paenibacillus sp. FSL H8-237]MEC0132059.1 peptidylprolyl isomerase [Paenibacillus odorifer]MEC0221741.1 peptidylprolyl isomerase [Paenibacillus odorifer]OZQ73895.1 hypothetical protein CA596_18090 [Paenibacillus odorifer]